MTIAIPCCPWRNFASDEISIQVNTKVRKHDKEADISLEEVPFLIEKILRELSGLVYKDDARATLNLAKGQSL